MDDELYLRFRLLESHHWWFLARREIVLGLLATLVPGGSRLLDVGCGTGFFLERARELYATSGVDPSPIALSMCADRKLAGIHVGSATDLSAVQRDRFDIVTLLDVIEHVDDELRALQTANAARVPGGRVVVTVPAFQFLWTAHDVVNQHRRRYTTQRRKTALEASGCHVERVTYFNCYLFPLAFVERLLKRVLHLDAGPDLSLPPAPLNSAMYAIFGAERQRLVQGGSFPIGLSVLAVGRVPEATVDAASKAGAPG